MLEMSSSLASRFSICNERHLGLDPHRGFSFFLRNHFLARHRPSQRALETIKLGIDRVDLTSNHLPRHVGETTKKK
jgi:hypothetical protein